MTPEQFAEAQEKQARYMEDKQARRDATSTEMQRLISLRGKTTFDPKQQTTFTTMYQETQAKEQAAREAAEAARVAALTPRDIWVSTLSWTERQRISKWESVNKMSYPIPTDFAASLKAGA